MDRSTLVKNLINKGVLKTPIIIRAFENIDRKDFVLPKDIDDAYIDTPLSIEHGQTISQPYAVAFMLELLDPQAGENILDVGSGSGWTTALLSYIVGKTGVVSGVERVPELVTFGQKNVMKYDCVNAYITQVTKELGLKEHAPYDKILVSAEGNEVPKELVDQVKLGGVIVMPVNGAILKSTKMAQNKVEIEKYEGFSFVPLIG